MIQLDNIQFIFSYYLTQKQLDSLINVTISGTLTNVYPDTAYNDKVGLKDARTTARVTTFDLLLSKFRHLHTEFVLDAFIIDTDVLVSHHSENQQ